MTDKPKRQTPFSPGGSHYKPPRGGGASGYVEKPARGEPATGSAGDKKPYSAEHQASPEAKAAGHAVAAEVRERIAARKHELVDKAFQLAFEAKNEQVQAQMTTTLLGKITPEEKHIDMTSKGQSLVGGIDRPPRETREEWHERRQREIREAALLGSAAGSAN